MRQTKVDYKKVHEHSFECSCNKNTQYLAFFLLNQTSAVIQPQVAHYQLMKCNAIRAFVQKRWYLTWPEDPQDLDWFYEQLISQILKDTKVEGFAKDKPEAVKPEETIQLKNVQKAAACTVPKL